MCQLASCQKKSRRSYGIDKEAPFVVIIIIAMKEKMMMTSGHDVTCVNGVLETIQGRGGGTTELGQICVGSMTFG